jgi:hypothetical protein
VLEAGVVSERRYLSDEEFLAEVDLELRGPLPLPLTPEEWRLSRPPPRRRGGISRRRREVRLLPFSELEEAQLRRLVYQAFDLRDRPYLLDAVAAIVDWNERTLPDRLLREVPRA